MNCPKCNHPDAECVIGNFWKCPSCDKPKRELFHKRAAPRNVPMAYQPGFGGGPSPGDLVFTYSPPLPLCGDPNCTDPWCGGDDPDGSFDTDPTPTTQTVYATGAKPTLCNCKLDWGTDRRGNCHKCGRPTRV